jgi:hypothetical protein
MLYLSKRAIEGLMSISLTETRDFDNYLEVQTLRLFLWTIAALGLLFQVGHFFEHAFQWVVWLLGNTSEICGRVTPWVSGWVSDPILSAMASFSLPWDCFTI